MPQVTSCAARHRLGAPDQHDQELGVQQGPVQQHVGSGDVESSLAGEPFMVLVEYIFTIGFNLTVDLNCLREPSTRPISFLLWGKTEQTTLR